MPILVVFAVLVLGIAATFVVERHRSGDKLESSMREFAETQAAFSNVSRLAA